MGFLVVTVLTRLPMYIYYYVELSDPREKIITFSVIVSVVTNIISIVFVSVLIPVVIRNVRKAMPEEARKQKVPLIIAMTIGGLLVAEFVEVIWGQFPRW